MLLVFAPLTPCCHLDATKPRTHGKCLGAAFHVPSFAFVAHAFELEWALWLWLCWGGALMPENNESLSRRGCGWHGKIQGSVLYLE